MWKYFLGVTRQSYRLLNALKRIETPSENGQIYLGALLYFCVYSIASMHFFFPFFRFDCRFFRFDFCFFLFFAFFYFFIIFFTSFQSFLWFLPWFLVFLMTFTPLFSLLLLFSLLRSISLFVSLFLSLSPFFSLCLPRPFKIFLFIFLQFFSNRKLNPLRAQYK